MKNTKRIIQAFPQAPWRSQTQMIGLFMLFLIAVAIVGVFYLNVTAEATLIGREIQEMQATISAVEIENSALELDLGNLSSVDRMRDRARDLGFDPIAPEEMEFIVVDGYYQTQPQGLMALNEEPSVRSNSEPVPADLPDEYFESIFTWLLRKYYDRTFEFPNESTWLPRAER